MADRREFQQERSRLLRDPEAGDNTQIEDAAGEGFGVGTELPQGTDSIEGAGAYEPEPLGGVGHPDPEGFRDAMNAAAARPEVEVTAAIVDDGIAVTVLIPHGLIGVALSE